MFERLIEKQEKQSRRQAKENRKAAEATQQANDNMMAVVIELFRDLQGGRKNKKKKKTMPRVIGTKDLLSTSTPRQHNQISTGYKGSNCSAADFKNQQITYDITNGNNEDNETEIDLGSDDNDLGSAAQKQDEGWHNAIDEDEDAEMNNYTSDDGSNYEDDDDDDDDESSNSQSEDSTDDSSNNSTRTPPAENKRDHPTITGKEGKSDGIIQLGPERHK
jgi:hypothetical protein